MDLVRLEEGKFSESAEVRRNIILNRVGEAQVQASAELAANLRQMVNNPAFSDMVFVCNDGERVQASRLLLAGRSDVLKGMLISGMVESSLSEIELPTISSPVLLCVLEFLYTGNLSDYYPRNWRMVWEVITASRFFLLPGLGIMIRKFMLDQLSSVAEDLPKVASLLTEAVESKAIYDETDISFTDVSLTELVTILSSKWSEPSYVKNLSEDALHYLLASTKGNCENDHQFSLVEYLRFRQIIRWWLNCRNEFGSGDLEELLDCVTPDEKEALAICSNLEKNIDTSKTYLKDGSLLSNILSFSEESRQCANKLLSNIDFRRIPPVLLATVVEPLKIVSPTDIDNAFRYHAVRNRKNFQRDCCEWDHGESHRVLDRGYAISKAKSTNGVAVMMAPMSASYAIYKWIFIVEVLPSGFFELGFTSQIKNLEGKKLSNQFGASKVLDFLHSGARIIGDDRHRWKKLPRRSLLGTLTRGSVVGFEFNAYDGTCSLSLDDEDYGIILENIPRRTYYPAVSLGESRDGRVRVELLEGFGML